jgi:hypothetical protein
LKQAVERLALTLVERAEHLFLDVRECAFGLRELLSPGVSELDQVPAPILGRASPLDQCGGFEIVERPDDVRRIHLESGGEHLLHIDSSIQADRSVTRRLTARARDVWHAAHPAATVTYRDLGSKPLPHFDTDTGMARAVPADLRTPAQADSWALSEELINEIKEADTVLLGLPLYNFAAPSSVKT